MPAPASQPQSDPDPDPGPGPIPAVSVSVSETPSASSAEWGPPWSREIADLYGSGTARVFVLHGNVGDLVPAPEPDGRANYLELPDFLANRLFASWDLVLGYEPARGLRPLAGGDVKRLQTMERQLSERLGEPIARPRDPDGALRALDVLIERNLIETDPSKRKSMAIVFDHAQFLVPEGDLAADASAIATRLARFLNWSRSSAIRSANVAFCLIAEALPEINDRLTRQPRVAPIEVPLPDRDDRRRFVDWAVGSGSLAEISELGADAIANLANGLALVNLQVLLEQGTGSAKGRKIDAERFGALKKDLIERQCLGLLEFIKPNVTLDMLVCPTPVKDRLRQDARLIIEGRLNAVPMGYLICGPVGTGKSFAAECYAGTIGIPCVKLRNFRSKYVGETEANLERLLNVLRSLGPVVVVIDEADAALGTRQGEGDSGTSSRVFAAIAAQMGDTRYRGKIVWMLLTSRPDQLPIDLKRQGRAEVHIPLFPPQTPEEVRALVEAMSRKNKVRLADGWRIPDRSANPTPNPDSDSGEPDPHARPLSGSELESLILAAHRLALIAERDEVTQKDIDAAWSDFLPSPQNLERDFQELAAVMECTQAQFLPERWRTQASTPDGRARLRQRMAELQRLLRD